MGVVLDMVDIFYFVFVFCVCDDWGIDGEFRKEE